jgi:hypothetical protein
MEHRKKGVRGHTNSGTVFLTPCLFIYISKVFKIFKKVENRIRIEFYPLSVWKKTFSPPNISNTFFR